MILNGMQVRCVHGVHRPLRAWRTEISLVCKVIIEHIFEFLSAGLTQICMEVPYFAVEITGTACENQTTEEKLEVCVLKILRRTRYIEKDIRGRGARKKATIYLWSCRYLLVRARHWMNY